jgi:dTDP-glucose 4,6-dehydratase
VLRDRASHSSKVRSPTLVTDDVLRGAHAVVHLAAESHVDRSIDRRARFYETNVLGTQQLLESARGGVQRFVHVSTDEVYGSIGRFVARGPHARAELAVLVEQGRLGPRRAGLSPDLRTAVMVTRCSNNYGPRQFPEKVIPLFVTNLFDGVKVPLYGDGLNVRDWLHVDDHCRGILACSKHGRPARSTTSAAARN